MKDYLGDSVYAQTGSYRGEIILTTDNGMGPSNTIVIDQQILRFLNTFSELELKKLDSPVDSKKEVSNEQKSSA